MCRFAVCLKKLDIEYFVASDRFSDEIEKQLVFKRWCLS